MILKPMDSMSISGGNAGPAGAHPGIDEGNANRMHGNLAKPTKLFRRYGKVSSLGRTNSRCALECGTSKQRVWRMTSHNLGIHRARPRDSGINDYPIFKKLQNTCRICPDLPGFSVRSTPCPHRFRGTIIGCLVHSVPAQFTIQLASQSCGPQTGPTFVPAGKMPALRVQHPPS